jgi:hypothetical protein
LLNTQGWGSPTGASLICAVERKPPSITKISGTTVIATISTTTSQVSGLISENLRPGASGAGGVPTRPAAPATALIRPLW